MGFEEYDLLKSTLEEVSNLDKKRSSNSQKYSDLKQESTLMEKELKKSPTVDEIRAEITETDVEHKGGSELVPGLFLLFGSIMCLYAIFMSGDGENDGWMECLFGLAMILVASPLFELQQGRAEWVSKENANSKRRNTKLRRSLRRIEQLPGLIDDSEEMLRRITYQNNNYDKSIEDKLASISHLIPYSDFLPEKIEGRFSDTNQEELDDVSISNDLSILDDRVNALRDNLDDRYYLIDIMKIHSEIDNGNDGKFIGVEKNMSHIHEDVEEHYTQILFLIQEMGYPIDWPSFSFTRDELIEYYEKDVLANIDVMFSNPGSESNNDFIIAFPEYIDDFIRSFCIPQ